jgi:hypothetical protein
MAFVGNKIYLIYIDNKIFVFGILLEKCEITVLNFLEIFPGYGFFIITATSTDIL